MRRIKSMGRGRVFAVALAGAGALALVLAMGAATASAAPGERAQRVRPDSVAIAIGELQTPNGGSAWLSLHAGSAGEAARGGFRYSCPAAGYYNGAVRVLTVDDGAIHAEGAGGLVRPDGTRMRVRFTLDVAADGSAISVSITGDDYEYDMSGSLDGFVFAGAPPAR